jgi:hypothetical protein
MKAAYPAYAPLLVFRHCVGNQTDRLELQQYKSDAPRVAIAARVLGIVALATFATQALGEDDFPIVGTYTARVVGPMCHG